MSIYDKNTFMIDKEKEISKKLNLKNYYARNREKCKALAIQAYKENREQRLAYQKEYYKKNREAIKERRRSKVKFNMDDFFERQDEYLNEFLKTLSEKASAELPVNRNRFKLLFISKLITRLNEKLHETLKIKTEQYGEKFV